LPNVEQSGNQFCIEPIEPALHAVYCANDMSQSVVADLHAHTTASDGELLPEELVDLAANAGLEALAITDHDSVAGVDRALAQGIKRGIEIVPGCELTVYEAQIELHVLALFIDHHSAPFSALIQKMRDHRRARALEICARLRRAGINIADSDVLEAAGGADAIGRPHVAMALIRRGFVRSLQAAFTEYLGEGTPGYVRKFSLSADEAFCAVHAAGGLAFLAHPGPRPHDELIAPLFRRGMDGVEANYPNHSPVNRRFYAGIARRYEKLICGGSDFHGPLVKSETKIGAAGIDRPALNALRRKSQQHTM